MAVSFACPGCATPFELTADMAGKRAQCPQCRMVFTLPDGSVASPEIREGTGRGEPGRRGARRDFGDERDRDRDRDEAARRPGRRRSVLPWVLGIGIACVLLFVVCGGSAAVIFYLVREDVGGGEAVALAREAVLHPPGANLPAGAPRTAMRVTNFKGAFQVRSIINAGDPAFDAKAGGGNNNKRCKEYVIDLEAGKNYTIDLESTAFDAYLRLEELGGQRIAEDDDSGGSLNSRIHFIPPRSTSYVVVATSLGGGFGNFTLTVRESQLPMPR